MDIAGRAQAETDGRLRMKVMRSILQVMCDLVHGLVKQEERGPRFHRPHAN